MVKNTRNQQVRGGVALPPVKRAQPLTRLRIVEIENYAKRNSTSQTYEPRRYAGSNKGTPAPSRTSDIVIAVLEAQKTAPLPVRSSIATTPCRSAAYICSDLQTHVIRQARIEVTAAYALNYLELRVLKLSELLQDFPASLWFLNSAIAAIIARAANMIALIGTVLYNAIKEYYDDGTRKTIHFYGYTVEAIHANYIKNSRSNVTVLDNHYDNDVDNILIKCTDDEQQRYNTLIEDYNRAGKREDNILTVDKCRTGYSNKEDIEADEREEETRVQLRESSGEIHDILLREFRGANDFTESVTHNDDEQELELEDCDALVERYEEEINCSDLYSTM
ncbi:hypothetical protein HBH43_245620 [Parastagonospora nodorum]|nr:hypothetical protein HBH43_245620 [Parastagonospora nodorum]